MTTTRDKIVQLTRHEDVEVRYAGLRILSDWDGLQRMVPNTEGVTARDAEMVTLGTIIGSIVGTFLFVIFGVISGSWLLSFLAVFVLACGLGWWNIVRVRNEVIK